MGNDLVLASVTGALLITGLVLVMGWARRPIPRLADAMALLDGTPIPQTNVRDRVPFHAEATGLLMLRNADLSGHLRHKMAYGMAGALAPGLLCAAMTVGFGWTWAIPLIVSVAGGLIGFVGPDVVVVRGGRAAREDAREALFTYFDLVTLERLGNLSTSQALASAASVSEAWLFVRIREALHRSHLQQRAPWQELTTLAEDLGLQELADIADIMRLDETGAALSGTLRARVRELRDAHLTDVKVAAHAVSESMTFAMAIPTLVFGLIFIVPPILRLLA